MQGRQSLIKGLTVYSILGWLIEGLHHVWTEGSFKKPNFLHGPYKPMYGIAAMLLLAANSLGKAVFFLASFTIPVTVEYMSGAWLKRDFGLKYWDYSQERGQFQGLICYKFAFYWVALSYMLVKVVDPLVQKLLSQSMLLKRLLSIVSKLFMGDMIYTLAKRYRLL